MSAALVSYSGSSSSDEQENEEVMLSRETSEKRSLKEVSPDQQDSRKKQKLDQRKKISLPLPDNIREMFSDGGRGDVDPVDDPEQHGGRIRSFAHEKGNWATYVCIPWGTAEPMTELTQELLLCLRPFKFEPMADFHVSLSRTVTIRHHWMEPLITSLRMKLAIMRSCMCELGSIKLYTNDEKNRSFLAIEVQAADKNLQKYVKAVDECYKEYKLPTYYTNPSFHISIAWALGDLESKVTPNVLEKLQTTLDLFKSDNPDVGWLHVRQICCKSGNKEFQFQLVS